MTECPNSDFFKELFETYRLTMYKIAFNILHNSHDSEDAVQSAFLWIINNSEKILQIPCNERVFYFANIIEHVAINMLNKKKRHTPEDIDLHEEINSEISTEKISLEKIAIKEIKEVIRSMSEADRLILRLYLFEERSHKEIAEIAGISETNARVSVHRARKRLVKLLKERGIDYEY